MSRLLSGILVVIALGADVTPALAAPVEIPVCQPSMGVRVGYRIQSHLASRPSGKDYLAGEDFGDYHQYATVSRGVKSGYFVHWELRPGQNAGPAWGTGGLYTEYLQTLAYFDNIDSIDIRTDAEGVPDTENAHVPVAQSYVSGTNQFDPVALSQKELARVLSR